jgi:uncharacterized protein YuzB (UPF0349 family)
MVKICGSCSNVNVEKLKSILPPDQIIETCLFGCSSYEGKSFGFINGNLVVSNTEQDFLESVKDQLRKE